MLVQSYKQKMSAAARKKHQWQIVIMLALGALSLILVFLAGWAL